MPLACPPSGAMGARCRIVASVSMRGFMDLEHGQRILIDDRADIACRVGRIADIERIHRAFQAFDQAVCDFIGHKENTQGRAALPRRPKAETITSSITCSFQAEVSTNMALSTPLSRQSAAGSGPSRAAPAYGCMIRANFGGAGEGDTRQ